MPEMKFYLYIHHRVIRLAWFLRYLSKGFHVLHVILFLTANNDFVLCAIFDSQIHVEKHIRIKSSNYLFSIFHFYPDCCVKIIYNIRFSISKQYILGMGYLFLTSGNLFSLLIFVWEFIQIYVSNSYCNYLEKYPVLSREEYFYLYVDLLFHFTFHINKGTNYLLMFEFCTFILYFPCVS